MSFPPYIAILCSTQLEEQWRRDLVQHQHFIHEETEAQKGSEHRHYDDHM